MTVVRAMEVRNVIFSESFATNGVGFVIFKDATSGKESVVKIFLHGGNDEKKKEECKQSRRLTSSAMSAIVKVPMTLERMVSKR